MKSRVKYEAVATIGKYKDRTTGEEKKQFLRVGTVFEAEDGRLSLKLDAVPSSPEWSGFISFYEPKGREEQSAPPQRQQLPDVRHQQRSMPDHPAPAQDIEDGDIPF